MRKKSRLVCLPHVTPAVTLPPRLADVLEIIIAGGPQGVTTLELLHAGHLGPANTISELRNRGAMLGKASCQVIGHHGRVYKGVARYTYLGWESPTELYASTSESQEVAE